MLMGAQQEPVSRNHVTAIDEDFQSAPYHVRLISAGSSSRPEADLTPDQLRGSNSRSSGFGCQLSSGSTSVNSWAKLLTMCCSD